MEGKKKATAAAVQVRGTKRKRKDGGSFARRASPNRWSDDDDPHRATGYDVE
jgi:hypothetical protein